MTRHLSETEARALEALGRRVRMRRAPDRDQWSAGKPTGKVTTAALEALRRVERELERETDPGRLVLYVARELQGLDRLSVALVRADTLKRLRALDVPDAARLLDSTMRSLRP